MFGFTLDGDVRWRWCSDVQYPFCQGLSEASNRECWKVIFELDEFKRVFSMNFRDSKQVFWALALQQADPSRFEV